MDDSSEEIIKRLPNSSDSEMMDDSIEEIIKRLPIKKVFECMSLSKHLHSRILSPAFTESYRNHHPCYLIMNNADVYDNHKASFYYSPLLPCGDMISEREPEEFLNSFTVHGDHETKYTQPVHGIFCVYSRLEKRLSIYHLWRGEIMKLPYPLIKERSYPDDIFIGFEPVNGVYKLLKITDTIGRDIDSICFDCEILTMDMDCNNKSKFSWRKLPDNILAPLSHTPGLFVTMSFFAGLRFSIDGFLFWGSYPTHGLICFDLKEEKFFLVESPPDLSHVDFLESLTTEFRGKFALFIHNPDDDERLILYTLTIQKLDHDDNQGYTYAWTQHFISLPSGMNDLYFPVGNLPTGEMLISKFETADPVNIVYAYNHETRLFQKFVVGKLRREFCRTNQPKKLIYIVCCVQPSFSKPDALGASFSSGD